MNKSENYYDMKSAKVDFHLKIKKKLHREGVSPESVEV